MKKIWVLISLMMVMTLLVSCVKHDTLTDSRVNYSLDDGKTYQNVNEKQGAYTIAREQLNPKDKRLIFFYAFTYTEFLKKLEDPKLEINKYFDEKGFDTFKNRHDEAYFREHLLIFYYKMESNISPNHTYSVTKYNQTLTLNVIRQEGMSTALSNWMDVVTIKKSDAGKVSKINLIVRDIS